MRLLRQPGFLAVALSHLAVDILNGQTGVLLAVLSVPLALSHAALGLIATLYSMLGSVSQPAFGWLADRYGARWATAGGVLWMAGFFSLVAVAPPWWAVVFLVAGALGSAAFHPPGAMKAAQFGHRYMAGQAATAASLFFLFGQGGLSLGPALGGAVIDTLGRGGLLLVTIAMLPIGVYTLWHLRPTAAAERPAQPGHAAMPDVHPALALFALVMLLSGLRSWIQMSTTTFTPKFLQDAGVSPTIYGAVVALFMAGSAVGGVFGGMLGDRWGARRVIPILLALSALPFYFFPSAGGVWVYLLAGLAGLLSGAPHSVFVTLAQRSLPGKAALASGVILGLTFTAGALGVYLSGLAADRIGLAPVLQANAGLALAAAVLSLGLRPGVPASRPVVAPAGD